MRGAEEGRPPKKERDIKRKGRKTTRRKGEANEGSVS